MRFLTLFLCSERCERNIRVFYFWVVRLVKCFWTLAVRLRQVVRSRFIGIFIFKIYFGSISLHKELIFSAPSPLSVSSIFRLIEAFPQTRNIMTERRIHMVKFYDFSLSVIYFLIKRLRRINSLHILLGNIRIRTVLLLLIGRCFALTISIWNSSLWFCCLVWIISRSESRVSMIVWVVIIRMVRSSRFQSLVIFHLISWYLSCGFRFLIP